MSNIKGIGVSIIGDDEVHTLLFNEKEVNEVERRYPIGQEIPIENLVSDLMQIWRGKEPMRRTLV